MAQGSIKGVITLSHAEAGVSPDDFERAVCESYLRDIVPLITAIEVYDNEFPAEILNEVRSLFTHFARCKVVKDDEIIADNLQKAERHLKRLCFDCYKYIAAIHAVKAGEFLEAYTPKVLAGVNDGSFLVKVNELLGVADELVIRAKTFEAEGDEAAALEHYAKAAEEYAGLDALIKSSRESIAHAQALYGSFEESLEKSNKSGQIIGVVGIAIGVIGVLVGVLGVVL